ncbi:MAG: protease-like activity factor CPAF [Parachlamydiaceae bacterium]
MSYFSKITLMLGTALSIHCISNAYEDDPLKMKMLNDLDFITNTLKVQYTPIEWKVSYSGWDVDLEANRAKAEIAKKEKISIKDYQQIIKNFLNTTNDYHVAVKFYSTESASLPLRIKGAEGRYFITQIDRTRLSPIIYPITEGDELISYNGIPIDEAVCHFKKTEVGGTNEFAAQALAEVFFTNRSGIEGHLVPKGPALLVVKNQQTGKLNTYQIMWHHLPEKIASPFKSQLPIVSLVGGKMKQEVSSLRLPLKDHAIFKQLMLSTHFDVFNAKASDDLGARQSFIPTLGKKIWEADYRSPYYAYLFETPSQRRIAYIRLPHFVEWEDSLEHFKAIIDFFQSSSEALVIDQVNNPGGSLFYLYALISMLNEHPVATPRHIISLTQKEIAYAIQVLPILESINSDEEARMVLGDVMEGNQVTYQTAQFFINYLRFIISEWNEGKIVTSPTYLWGIDLIPPHPEVRYTKPILILINSLDFSGGDFFPAIMQDSNRAILLGTQTAGAGGFVYSVQFPNLFGIESFSYTASLAQRHNKQFIENLGVSPDIPYALTVDDLQNNYRTYAAKILETVDQMLEKKE